jgi:hypothetical protein
MFAKEFIYLFTQNVRNWPEVVTKSAAPERPQPLHCGQGGSTCCYRLGTAAQARRLSGGSGQK